MHFFLYFLSLLPFYLLGSFPTGHLIAKAKGVNISQTGSCNVGATNVARVVGKRAGLVTLIVDMGKGLLGTAAAFLLTQSISYASLAGLTLVAGHCFSIPGKLKGGKGVATTLGVILFLSPKLSLFAIVTFILVFLLWRIVSLSSICTALSIPAYALLVGTPEEVTYALAAICLLVIYRHKENLERLIEGSESKLKVEPKS